MSGLKQKTGFTIVELLIVIVVIAILATLTIVAFNSVQQRARESSVKTALSQAKRKLETYKVDNGTYPLTGNLASAQLSNSSTLTYDYTSNGTTYCMTATEATTSYQTTESTAATTGGCAGHAQGGAPAVTNLVLNPSFESGTVGGWSAIVGATMNTVSSGQGIVSGSNALEFTVTTSNQSGVQVFLSNLAPSTTYTVSGSLTLISGDPTAMGVRMGDGAGTRASSTLSPVLSPGATRRVTLTWTSSATPNGSVQFWRSGAAPSSAVLRLDGVMVQQGGSASGYADGSTTNWIWNGTAHNSTSTGPAQ
jgi:prepilin-type N-terminal cleavage/methylation domain-containing protein